MKGRIWLSALAVSASFCSVALADLGGKVIVEGDIPKPKEIKMAAVADCAKQHANKVMEEKIVAGEKGELKNAVVYIKDGAKLGGEIPKEPVTLDQVGCIYTPHVVAVMVGQDLKVKNSDGFLHNVHGLAKENGEFNFPQQQGDERKIEATKAVETYKIKCDVHPWMAAHVVVLDHPYSSVTGDDGTFNIKGVKDGDYTLHVWTEGVGETEVPVTVKDGKPTAPVEIKMQVKKKAQANPADIKGATETLVSAPVEKCEACKKAAVAAN